MAKQQDKSIKTFTGARISTKQFKLFLARAKTPTERAALKALHLGEPLKFYGKAADAEEAAGVQTDLKK